MATRARKRDAGEVPRNYIRPWRLSKDWTLIDLLERLEPLHVIMTEGHLSKVERSKTPVDTGTLHALAVIFKTTPIALMLGPPDDPLVKAIDMLGPLSVDARADAVEALASALRLHRRGI